ncbi:heme A synthase [Sphingorhabdus lutea]|uniref:Heme A synthase n=1 Tax=Sphingorhabdus lutea TaxID=1913578 RepID=A0A1L3J9H4_9SPHN|nr:COX15/CtaA family protein [Sphingorhabdus lutea]APG61786.1 heme A synthase [Sphingorhabdus lutea]
MTSRIYSNNIYNKLIYWLYFVASLVFAMVVVGGITRLTESGLSITEWKPITGALPPLNQADWVLEFEKYKQIPEYIEINGPAGMTLAQFKFIYFWEWVHRLLGRLIGLAFAIPLAWFWIKQQIPQDFKPRLLALLALGGLQGAIGWWMVSSGLSQRTDVSHFRLAAHLITALIILAGIIWTALDLKSRQNNPQLGIRNNSKMTSMGIIILSILFVQLLLGAWVAGLNAGYVASDWPLMNEHFYPDGVDWDKGMIFALTHDPFLLHFLHRWWAWILVGALILLARRVKKDARPISIAIHCAFGIQIIIGIATVMTGMNIILAVLHQAVGALVVIATLVGVHHLGKYR